MNQTKIRKLRLYYVVALVCFIFIEVGIALYVHDTLIRPYVGDILVVVVLYCLLRIFLPTGYPWLLVPIFLFATLVEGLQYFNLVQVLGVQSNRILSVLIGTTFDVKDVVCYAIGCILLGIYEILSKTKKKK